jgi:hypothetical protein
MFDNEESREPLSEQLAANHLKTAVLPKDCTE